MNDVSRKQAQFLPYLFVIIPILLTIILGGTAWLVKLTDTQRIQATWTLASFLVGAAATIVLRHVELFRSISDMRLSIEKSAEKNEHLFELNKRMMRVENALRDETQFERVASLNDAMGSITAMRLTHPGVSDLISWKSERLFSKALREHMDLAMGLIYIDDVNKELNTNETLLRTLPKDTVEAVSYQDDLFWNSPEGASLLEAHKEINEKGGVKSRRVFIVEGESPELTVRLNIQKQNHIEVRVINKDRLAGQKPEDFVIYDDKFVRTGYLAEEDRRGHGSLSNKFAMLTWQRDRVDHHKELFRALWLRATAV